MARVPLTAMDREQMAYRLTPVLQDAVVSGGAYTTLLDAHESLFDPENKLEVTAPELGPGGELAAGIIIIIRT